MKDFIDVTGDCVTVGTESYDFENVVSLGFNDNENGPPLWLDAATATHLAEYILKTVRRMTK